MRRLTCLVALLFAAGSTPAPSLADVLVPGQPRRPPVRPPPPSDEVARERVLAALREQGHDCPRLARLGEPTPEDIEIAGRKDLHAWRAHCSNGRMFVVGLPLEWEGRASAARAVVKPLP